MTKILMKIIVFITLLVINIFPLFAQTYKFKVVDPEDNYYLHQPDPRNVRPEVFYFSEEDKWRLTKNDKNLHTAIWNDDDNGNFNLDLTKNFCLKFRVQFSKYLNDYNGADGIAFVLRSSTSNCQYNQEGCIGLGGGYIGYRSIDPSFAIEFDTYYNGLPEDLLTDHLGYYSLKNWSRTQYGDLVNISSYYNDNVEDGKWYLIEINWSATEKTITTLVNNNLRKSETVDLIQILETNIVCWGYTAATASNSNEQSIKQLSVKEELCCNVDLKILGIGNINNENINDIYPNYNYNNFGGPLKVCSGTSVTFRADVDPGVSRVEWWKKEFDANGGSTETLVDTQFPPTDYYDKEFVFNEDYSTMIIAKVVYNNGCEASENMTVIPIQFMIQLPPNKFLCAETETYI